MLHIKSQNYTKVPRSENVYPFILTSDMIYLTTYYYYPSKTRFLNLIPKVFFIFLSALQTSKFNVRNLESLSHVRESLSARARDDSSESLHVSADAAPQRELLASRRMVHTERAPTLQLDGFRTDGAGGQRVLLERAQPHEVIVTWRTEVGTAETEVDGNRATVPASGGI